MQNYSITIGSCHTEVPDRSDVLAADNAFVHILFISKTNKEVKNSQHANNFFKDCLTPFLMTLCVSEFNSFLSLIIDPKIHQFR